MALPPKKRYEDYFDRMNKGGYMTLEIVKKGVDNLVSVCKPSEEETKRLYDMFNEFWAEIGLVLGKKITKEQFVNGAAQFAEREMKANASGEKTLHRKYARTLFDVIDTNDDVTISLEELTIFFEVFHFEKTWAERDFQVIDTNKNGKIQIEEYLDYFYEYWCEGKH